MNKIVRENYPVSNLPANLRQEFTGQTEVAITVEETVRQSRKRVSPHQPFGLGVLFSISKFGGSDFSSTEKVVAHVRALRDEWDERDRLIPPDQ